MIIFKVYSGGEATIGSYRFNKPELAKELSYGKDFKFIHFKTGEDLTINNCLNVLKANEKRKAVKADLVKIIRKGGFTNYIKTLENKGEKIEIIK